MCWIFLTFRKIWSENIFKFSIFKIAFLGAYFIERFMRCIYLMRRDIIFDVEMTEKTMETNLNYSKDKKNNEMCTQSSADSYAVQAHSWRSILFAMKWWMVLQYPRASGAHKSKVSWQFYHSQMWVKSFFKLENLSDQYVITMNGVVL